jgi:hypothetical protein
MRRRRRRCGGGGGGGGVSTIKTQEMQLQDVESSEADSADSWLDSEVRCKRRDDKYSSARSSS